jgi:hypothetical protein
VPTPPAPPLAARDTDAWGRRCRWFGLHGRVRLAVPDDAGLDRLPDVLDAELTCGGAVADPFGCTWSAGKCHGAKTVGAGSGTMSR